ncbi:uncharacterized protein LOC143274872 [Babylonia areolata]|uniref:uncharacterized protein LOC143274872 n=1 Tax=Babylonia areolata TaxID=304850 RepID=UPI003FD19EC9
MIRYFPESVDHQLVNEARKAATGVCHQSDGSIMYRAAEVRKCRCSELMAPPPGTLRSCPVKPGTTSSLAAVLQLDPWTQVPWGRKVELMMSSRHPFMAALDPQYSCHPLHLVLTLCSEAAVKQFLDPVQQKNLGLKDSMGNTAFLLLVASNCAESYVEGLLKNMDIGDAQKLVREENKEGLTALHFAVLKSKKKLIQVLWAYGANINVGTVEINGRHYGITPFHLSLLQHSKHARQCFSYLLNHNADVYAEALVPMTSSAAVSFRFECRCGGCWSTPVKGFGAVLHKNAIGRPQRSVSMGSALNILAAFRDVRKNAFISRLLRSRRYVDVDQTDDRGMSPLAHAVLARDYEMVQLLMTRGPDINRTGIHSDGTSVESPMQLAWMMLHRGEQAWGPEDDIGPDPRMERVMLVEMPPETQGNGNHGVCSGKKGSGDGGNVSNGNCNNNVNGKGDHSTSSKRDDPTIGEIDWTVNGGSDHAVNGNSEASSVMNERGDGIVIADIDEEEVTPLNRLLQLDDISCPWCQYQDQEPLQKDNVSTVERDIASFMLSAHTGIRFERDEWEMEVMEED